MRGEVDYRFVEKLFGSASVAVAVVKGPDLRYVMANQAYGAALGAACTSIVGHTVAEVFSESSAFGAPETLYRVFHDGQPISQKERESHLPFGGNPTWWNVEYVPRHDGRGGVQAVLILAADVTEQVRTRRQVEEQAVALGQSEAMLRGLFNASAVIMNVLELADDDFVYVLPNATAAAFFGMPIEELTGKTARQLGLSEETIADRLHLLRQCRRTQRPVSLEYRFVHHGTEAWLHGTISPLPPGPTGRPRFILATVNITDRKRAEEQLKALNDTLEQQVLERTAVAEQRAAQLRVLAAELTRAEEHERHHLAEVLHDHLQQLLVAARMKVALLRRRASDEKVMRSLQQIDEVLNESITESRSLTAELSPPVLYDAGLAAGLEWLAGQMAEKHGLHTELATDPVAERTDEATRVFIFQAVRELLLNVVRHARIDTARVELTPLGDDQLRAVVSDAGVGFDPSTTEDRPMAEGYGLFSIRDRLELLGGRMAVDSSPGQGTRVTIEVACARPVPTPETPAPEPTVAAAEPAETGREEGLPRPRRKKTRVLLADDHAIMRQGLAGLLRDQAAIEVVGEAADGRQAVEVALRTRPDVVLMDVTMPVLNGIEATRRILHALPGVRVIGLSMHEEGGMATAMRHAGAVGYLCKDTASEDLIATILGQQDPSARRRAIATANSG